MLSCCIRSPLQGKNKEKQGLLKTEKDVTINHEIIINLEQDSSKLMPKSDFFTKIAPLGMLPGIFSDTVAIAYQVGKFSTYRPGWLPNWFSIPFYGFCVGFPFSLASTACSAYCLYVQNYINDLDNEDRKLANIEDIGVNFKNKIILLGAACDYTAEIAVPIILLIEWLLTESASNPFVLSLEALVIVFSSLCIVADVRTFKQNLKEYEEIKSCSLHKD